MRYLLDTHIVIWAMVGSKMLSDKARVILQTSGNMFYLSSASVWEVAIKHSAKPNEIPVTAEQVVRFCRESGIVELPVALWKRDYSFSHMMANCRHTALSSFMFE